MDNFDAIRADPKLCFLEKKLKVYLYFKNFIVNLKYLLGFSFKFGT